MVLGIQGHLITLIKCVKKWHCTQRFNQLTRKCLIKSEKGHNSVKIQIRVMGLGIKCHLMILNKCVKFPSNSIHMCVRKELARKGLTKSSKSKKEHNSVKIQFRVLELAKTGKDFEQI